MSSSPEQVGSFNFPEEGLLNPYDRFHLTQTLSLESDISVTLQSIKARLPATRVDSISGVAALMDTLDQLKAELADKELTTASQLFADYCNRNDVSLGDNSYVAEDDASLVQLLKMAGFSEAVVVGALTRIESDTTEVEQKNAAALRTLIESIYE